MRCLLSFLVMLCATVAQVQAQEQEVEIISRDGKLFLKLVSPGVVANAPASMPQSWQAPLGFGGQSNSVDLEYNVRGNHTHQQQPYRQSQQWQQCLPPPLAIPPVGLQCGVGGGFGYGGFGSGYRQASPPHLLPRRPVCQHCGRQEKCGCRGGFIGFQVLGLKAGISVGR